MQRKFTKFLFSLKFAIILLVLIAAYSIIGTIIPQGLAVEHYHHLYPTFGKLMVLLQFDDVYSSIIFRLIVTIFIVNLSGCTIQILPGQLNRMKNTYLPKPRKDNENLYDKNINQDDLKKKLEKKRFTIIEQEDGYYATKHRIGNIGSTLTHLGIIVIVLGGFVGNILAIEGSVSLMPGQETCFTEKDFCIGVEDFYIEFREDNSINQYFSDIVVYEDGEKVEEKTIWVNNPLTYKGLSIYQSFYGWINKLEISDSDGNLLVDNLMSENQNYIYEEENLRVYLYGYFPDFTMDSMGNPVTKSQKMINQRFAFVLYENNEYVDAYIVEPGEEVSFNDIVVQFVDPVLYTGLTYRQDFGYYYMLIGSLLMFIGLMFSFYFYPKYLYVTSDAIIPIARQNSWGYTYQIKNMLKTDKKGEGV